MKDKKRFIVLLPFCSALLVWLSYHPANISFLAWIAYVPFLLYLFIKSKESGFFKSKFSFWIPKLGIIGAFVLSTISLIISYYNNY